MAKRKPEQYQDMLSRLFPEEFENNGDKKNLVKTLTFQVTDSCNLACHYCVTGDTTVITKNMLNTPISLIQEGDHVLGFNPYSEMSSVNAKRNTFFTKVTSTMSRKDMVYRIDFEDGNYINITKDHPIRVYAKQNEFTSIADGLAVGDYVQAIATSLHDSEDVNPMDYCIGYLMAYIDFTKYFTMINKIDKNLYFKNNVDQEELDTIHNVMDWLDNIPWKNISAASYDDKILASVSKKDMRLYITPIENRVDFRIGYVDACKFIYKVDCERINDKYIDVFGEVVTKLESYIETINPDVSFTYKDPKMNVVKHLFRKSTLLEQMTITPFNTTKFKLSERKKITSIMEIGEFDVFNLETSSHTYFANNIAVHNCYQINKGTRVMDFEVAKKTIDLVLDADNPKNHYFNSEISPGIILEFIGGEPLLQIDLIDKVCTYFYQKAIELNHKWVSRFRISICSNGVNYFEENVQKFMKKWKDYLSFSVTIDGNKELHDSCRVFETGEGSYDMAVKAAIHYNQNYGYMGSKLTIAPENVQYLSDAVIHMIGLGYNEINANCVYEEGWNDETAIIYLRELTKLTEYWKENNLFDTHYISLFDNYIGKKMDPRDNSNWCGGTGYMMAVDPDGKFFPCIRYMESSLGTDIEPIVIGNVDTGIGVDEKSIETINCLDCITRRSQSSDDCFNCSVASGCAWCSAYNYQATGSVNKRATHICLMHKIRCYANTKFWNICNGTDDTPFMDFDIDRIVREYHRRYD